MDRNRMYARREAKGKSKTKGACSKGWIFVIILGVLFSGLFAGDMYAGECENAMVRCMDDPYWHMTLAGPLYCAAGYLFCKKYIEG